MERVSAIVTCFNRAKEIEACLSSLEWVDELIVVDSFSTDDTVEKARRFTDKVLQREYRSAADQKNWALARTSYDWVLRVDSDEIMPVALRDEISAVLKAPRFTRYHAYRRNYFLGKEIKRCGWNTDQVPILFRRDRHRFNEAEVHPRLIPEGKYGMLANRLVHHAHRSIDEFARKSNRYATWGAKKYFRQGRKGAAPKMFFHSLFNFIKLYIFRLGLLDGAEGLIICVLSSCYVAEKYAKLWEIYLKKESGAGK